MLHVIRIESPYKPSNFVRAFQIIFTRSILSLSMLFWNVILHAIICVWVYAFYIDFTWHNVVMTKKNSMHFIVRLGFQGQTWLRCERIKVNLPAMINSFGSDTCNKVPDSEYINASILMIHNDNNTYNQIAYMRITSIVATNTIMNSNNQSKFDANNNKITFVSCFTDGVQLRKLRMLCIIRSGLYHHKYVVDGSILLEDAGIYDWFDDNGNIFTHPTIYYATARLSKCTVSVIWYSTRTFRTIFLQWNERFFSLIFEDYLHMDVNCCYVH